MTRASTLRGRGRQHRDLHRGFRTNLARRFPPEQQAAILALCGDQARLEATAVSEFMDLFVV